MAHVQTIIAKEFEGCEKRLSDGTLTAYWDILGHIWIIGWGHTGPEIVPGLIWTQLQADNQLALDLLYYEKAVENMLTHSASQGQFDAFVDFTYNEGVNALRKSVLLGKFNSG